MNFNSTVVLAPHLITSWKKVLSTERIIEFLKEYSGESTFEEVELLKIML